MLCLRRIVFLSVLVWVAAPAAVCAQSSRAAEAPADVLGSIAGRVIDAENGMPLGGAVVTLHQVGADAALRVRSSAITDSLGRYGFVRLAPGNYQLRVERLGYAGSMVTVELHPMVSALVSVGLQLNPMLLPAVTVVTEAAPPFVRASPGQASVVGARRTVAQMRQETHLASDAREITRADVIEAVTLGETDLFRAIQRIPGVTTRDDFTAVLWTRGAPWDQTRVYFDGLPLYNPTHTGWLFSAVNIDGVGAVLFEPGVRSASLGEGAAGILNLESRSGITDDALSGSGELSMVSARLALSGSLLDRRVGWMLAARRTYVDWFGSLVSVFDSAQDSRLPYDFSDVIGRVDVRGPKGWSVEASGIAERDRLRGDIPRLLLGNRAHWGNVSGRVTLQGPLSDRTELSISRGFTRFVTLVSETDSAGAPSALRTRDIGSSVPALQNRIHHDRTSIRIGSRREAGRFRKWSLGAELVQDTLIYGGPFSLLEPIGTRARNTARRRTPCVRATTRTGAKRLSGCRTRWSCRPASVSRLATA
jgi:hypothetical protein